ncbi:MAG: peptidoglycan-binding protein, partial [Treponema sp.]|nr:peptidoglycan-binding protein [Treponema sp.]
MNCDELLDRVYEYCGEPLPLPLYIRVKLHCAFCPQCAQELERFELARDVLRNDFFPPEADFAEAVMAKLCAEGALDAENPGESGEMEGVFGEVAGVSLRGWVIAGLILFFSLASAFLGMDFIKIAASEGSSYMLPLGITIGAAVTCYGAV